MSDQNWALQMMFKYRLQVDFSSCTIEARGFPNCWCWDKPEDFYNALTAATNYIEKH